VADQYQEALKKLMDYMQDTVVFAKSQLPDIANQMLTYGAHMAHLWMIFWIIIAAVALLSFFVGLIAMDEGSGVCFISLLLIVAASIAACFQYGTQIKIKEAPKLYLMDELASRVYEATK